MFNTSQDIHAQVYEALGYEFISTRSRYEDQKEKFQKAFDTNPAYAIEWHAKDLARAQAEWELLFELGILPEEDGADLKHAAAVSSILEETLVRWMNNMAHTLGHYHGSRSTNAIANVLADVKAEVQIQFYSKVLQMNSAAIQREERERTNA